MLSRPQSKGALLRIPSLPLVPLLFSLLLSPALPADPLPTTDKLLTQMAAALTQMTSFQGAMRSVTTGPYAQTGTVDFAIEKSANSGKTIMRASMVANIFKKAPDVKAESLTQMKWICDGSIAWNEMRDADGKIIVTKMNAPAPDTTQPNVMVRDYLADAKTYNFKLVGEDSIDGRKMYVLDGAFDADTCAKRGIKQFKVRFWIAQDNLMLCRQVTTSMGIIDDQPSVETCDLLNVTLNEKIDPALFLYTPPPGVKIIDTTKPKP